MMKTELEDAYVQQSLVEPSISKDILMLTRVDKPALMKRLYELGCLYSGQILSYNKMIGQLQDAGNTTTLSHYLRLLDTAGFTRGPRKIFDKRDQQKGFQSQIPGAQHGIDQQPAGDSFVDIQTKPNEWGRLVESSIGAHLLNHALTDGFAVHYWREGNDEVDFVLRKKDKVIGLEVKNSTGSPGVA